ncbi:hypothetical protein ASE28_24745 [Acidovorax sp. Root219]|nr:hypothetical protein ASE28_24745 [Acidovorax sp. Root219]
MQRMRLSARWDLSALSPPWDRQGLWHPSALQGPLLLRVQPALQGPRLPRLTSQMPRQGREGLPGHAGLQCCVPPRCLRCL